MNSLAAEMRRSSHPIVLALAAAVPLWALRITDLSLDEILDRKELDRLGEAIHDAGEAVLYRVPGKTAAGFNATAEAIARLAYSPGGVTVFGMRFAYQPGNWRGGLHGVPVPEGKPVSDNALAFFGVAP